MIFVGLLLFLVLWAIWWATPAGVARRCPWCGFKWIGRHGESCLKCRGSVDP